MLFDILLVFVWCAAITKASVILDYTNEGVLRKDGNCDITFVNFGIDKTISKQSVTKTLDTKTGTFNVTLLGLVNGNVGLNYDTKFQMSDLYDYIKVTQDNETISSIDIPAMSSNGKFDLTIYNLSSCDGLTIKQTFKDETITVANFLYYTNVIPEGINRAFDTKLFGPSPDYPFERIHWKFNEGLDDLRETCGIYLKYDSFIGGNGSHWQYYLSTDSINSKECDPRDFAEVLKRNYVDYHYTEELLGENYMGYVLKREGNNEAHMDGVIADNNYIIEISQKSCNDEFTAKTVCTLTSEEPFTFRNFTTFLLKNCIEAPVDEEDYEFDEQKWEVASNGKSATGKLKNQIIRIDNSDRGSLPKKIDGDISYGASNTLNYTPVARFVISFSCGNGTFMNDTCQCQACPANCETCLNATTCSKCTGENRVLSADGSCECKASFFEDPLTKQCEPCNKECGTCNTKGTCTTCKDPSAVISDGVCICKKSFLTGEGACFKCDASCSKCDEFGCVACADPLKTPNEEGKCE